MSNPSSFNKPVSPEEPAIRNYPQLLAYARDQLGGRITQALDAYGQNPYYQAAFRDPALNFYEETVRATAFAVMQHDVSGAGFIVLAENPLEDIAHVGSIQEVVLRGEAVDRAGLRARWSSR